MKILRTATLIMVCLGLALPSSHVLALCMDSDGSLALVVAVAGACTGSKERGSDGEGIPAEGVGREADTVDCRDDCTDIVLGGGSAAIPPPALSGKHKLSRPIYEAVDPSDALGSSTQRASCDARFSSFAPVPERSPTCGSVVLRL